MATVDMGYVAAGDGPTVVAVHGGLLSGRLTFGPVLGDWAQRLRVLVPDRRGYERTPGTTGTMAEQARDLLAFIDRHAGGRAHVVGFSYGGLVALTALQLERRAFASCTVVEAPAVTLCGRDQLALELRAWLARLYETSVDGDPGGAGHDFFAVMDPRALSRIDALIATDDPGLHLELDELRVWHTPLSPVGLAGVAVPCAVVTGGRSAPAMRAIGRHVADATRGTHHVIEPAGHAAHLIGRPFRDLLCAHVADAEAAASWDDPVRPRPWTPEWARRYERERAAVTEALGGDAVDVAHIGSTAVEGLDAEPVVDMMVGVGDQAAIPPAVERVRALGYAHDDDPDDRGHAFLLRRADGERLVHLHVVVRGGRWWRDHVAFRDALRADGDLRVRYGERKRSLADAHRDDREAYTAAKSDFVRAALAAHGDATV